MKKILFLRISILTIFTLFLSLFLNIGIHAKEMNPENTFEPEESSVLFDHKGHETYDYSCRQCHAQTKNTCVDCHNFEEIHSDMSFSITDAQIEQPKSCITCHATKQYNALYDLLTGPFLWVSFLVFFTGIIIRSVLYIKGLDSTLDRVTYGVNTRYGVKNALKSIFYWLIPFGAKSWRTHPVMTVMTFIFHLSLIITPIFLMAHNMILEKRWGFSLATIPSVMADALTIAVLIAGIFLLLRRFILKEVRIITKPSDYLVFVITLAPFITGLFAIFNVPNYQFWLITHIIAGEIMLIAIPFTKLSHCFLFFFSRAQVGMDFGIKRGGMKGKGIVW